MDYRGALGLGGVREAGRRAGVEAVLGASRRRQEPEAQVVAEDERGLAAAARRRVVVDTARPKPRLDGVDEWRLVDDARGTGGRPARPPGTRTVRAPPANANENVRICAMASACELYVEASPRTALKVCCDYRRASDRELRFVLQPLFILFASASVRRLTTAASELFAVSLSLQAALQAVLRLDGVQ